LKRLTQAHPANNVWQGHLAAAYGGVGNAQRAQGDLAAAIASQRDSVAVFERLAQSDPGNTTLQHDLSYSYDNVGDVLLMQGDFAGALKPYLDSLATMQRLTQSDPSNSGWQRSLSISYDKVGDAQARQNDLAGALKSYRDSLAIRQQLVARDSNNAQWQKDLQVAASLIGGLAYSLVLTRDFATALAASDQAISVAPSLTWLYTNRAHALMFLGRTDDARALYLKYRDQKLPNGETWETGVLGDFVEFRKAGLADPLMNTIEKAFLSAG
jgi:tetratricopeptide (TPR) repeat protein